jgi:hypothetical protein
MSVKYCTGVAAQWCPIHGECTCPLTEWGERLMDDDHADEARCPLHSTWSTHAEEQTDEFEDGGGI